MRAARPLAENADLLSREGLTLHDLIKPDMRIRHRVVMEMLRRSVEWGRDPELGLRAGLNVEAGIFDPLEHAARSCVNLREALGCLVRYMPLIHGAQEAVLVEDGERASWQLRVTDDVPQLPAANEFSLTSACSFAQRYTGVRLAVYEVHFQHTTSTNLAAYPRIFGSAEVRLGMRHNALVFARHQLELPMLHAQPSLQRVFEKHVCTMLERLKRSEGTSGRVRQLLVAQLSTGDTSRASIARKLGISEPTLHRHLLREETSFGELLDDVRRELAKHFLCESGVPINDVASRLGFSSVPSFYKAFRRWFEGTTPAEYRAAFSAERGGVLAYRPRETPAPRNQRA